MLNEIEFEKSLKSDHEMRHEREKKQMELLKRGEIEQDLDGSKQTAQDMEDLYNEEFAKFKTAPRLTEADKQNDKKSINRKLEETLFLLVEQKLGDKKHFVLPQGKRADGESMRQTAERVLQEQCGNKLETVFYGNAPCGFYKYKYPASQRTETVGAKVFFFRTALRKAEVDSKTVQYQWVDKAELKTELRDSYYQSVSKFLL
jgi:large subunit ribosomal protein L46